MVRCAALPRFVCFVACLAAIVASCKDPTQIVLHVETNVACSDVRGVAIAAGIPGTFESILPQVVTTTCTAEGRIGTTVLAPMGDKEGAVAIRVLMGRDVDVRQCTRANKYKGCIVARRRLRYLRAQELRVVVRLLKRCIDVPCDELTTCAGDTQQCIPAEVDPSTCDVNGCLLEDAPSGGASSGTTSSSGSSGASSGGIDGSQMGIDGGPSGECAGGEPGSPWPMIGRCATHRSNIDLPAPVSVTQKWITSLGGSATVGSPVIAKDGTIYVTVTTINDCGVRAVNPDGTLKWSKNYAGYAEESPAIGSDGTVYVSHTGLLEAYRPDGSSRWTVPGNGAIFSSATIGADGTIYSGTTKGELLAIAPDGSVRWKHDFMAANSLVKSPAIGSDGTLYVVVASTSFENTLRAVTPAGQEQWQRALPGGSYPQVSIAKNGTLVTWLFGSPSWSVAAYTQAGVQLWTAFYSEVSARGAIGDDNDLVFPANGKVVRLGIDNMERWMFGVGTLDLKRPLSVFSGGGVATETQPSTNFTCVRGDGSFGFSVPLGAGTGGFAVAADGTIYVGDAETRLLAYTPTGL